MRLYFFDSSTFVKLFVAEPGSDRVHAMVRNAEADEARVRVSVCDLAHPETASALRQMLERGVGGHRGISSATLRQTIAELTRAVGSGSTFTVVRASDVVLDAATLAVRHYVRGADSVHVAAAQTMRNRVERGDEFWFVTSDLRQSEAARQEGIAVLDPTA